MKIYSDGHVAYKGIEYATLAEGVRAVWPRKETA